MVSINSLEELRTINSDAPLSKSVKQWKDSGKKVIGWTCVYVPEEMIDAAGALPVRIIGSCGEELEDSNAYLSTSSCSYCRTVLQLAMDNQLDFLDGIVFASTCDCMRILREVWERYVSIPVVGHLAVPRKSTESAVAHFRSELQTLKEKLEQFLGTQITEEALAESARVYNRGRKLVGQLYELRKADAPPVSGTEVLEILNAASSMPRREFNAVLERLLKELADTGRQLKADARLMVGGSIINNIDFFGSLEDFGGLVVVDELCTGIRQWRYPVEIGNGRSTLDNICLRYLDLQPCPMHMPMTNRFDEIVKLAKEYRVDGFILQKQRYCVPQAYDQPLLRRRLVDEGIPILELDREYATPGTGQVRTRVQAFMETIEGKKLTAAKTR